MRREVEAIARSARLDVGGIEYLESTRDGRRYYYDINALSNFVAEPLRVLGFDPTVNLVDAILAQAEVSEAHDPLSYPGSVAHPFSWRDPLEAQPQA